MLGQSARRDYLKNIAPRASIVAALVTAALGILWYFVALEGRLSRVEANLRAIATAPTFKEGRFDMPATDPIHQACANLAAKAAEAHKHTSALGNSFESMMRQLGCHERR